MRARLILIVAAGVVVSTMAMAPPADAGHLDWSFGVGFHAGGLHFRVGFAPAGWSGHSGPFFLTTSRLDYPGYACQGACFRRGAGYYHHASCPLLSFHFRRGGYGPDYYVHNYSPYRGHGPGYGYYPYRSYRSYRPYGHYYRDGYRSGYGHRYRGRGLGHYRGKGHGHDRYRGRDHHGGHHDRGRQGYRGRDYDHDSDSDSGGRHYRDRGSRGRGSRDYAQPRGRAQRTRPPR